MNNILIATPAYGCMLHIDYVNTVIALQQQKNNFNAQFMFIGNESLITRARNTCLSYFVNNSQFTHLFFLDADIGMPSDALQEMLNCGVDVIGAPVLLKGTGKEFNISGVKDASAPLWEVERLGTAVMLLSRKAINSLIQNADIYYRNPMDRGIKLAQKEFDVFKTGVVNGVYQSEDYWICNELKKNGFKIYCCPDIPIRHSGNYTWSTECQ